MVIYIMRLDPIVIFQCNPKAGNICSVLCNEEENDISCNLRWPRLHYLL